MDLYTVESQQRDSGSSWRAAIKVLVIAVGLVIGAVVGLIAAFSLNLITISC